MKYLLKFQQFMQGRYGPDALSKFLFKIYFILLILSLFIKSKIIVIINLLVFVIIFYRFFSRNIYRRSKENKFYLKIKDKIYQPFRNLKRNFKDRKECVYKKCHKCKKVLKLPLPSKRGIKHAKCPNCKKRLTFLVLRKEKVEIIRK